jgi:hypothetical protein
MAIVDTNFLLSNLGTLNALLDVSEDRPGNLLVIVPWQVILELDGLKVKLFLSFFLFLFLKANHIPTSPRTWMGSQK